MRDDKHIAIKLRKEGKSYNKISKELNIAKSTLSGWFSGLDWSDIIKQELARKANYVARKRLRLVNKQRREMWERWRQEHRDKAAYQFPLLKKNPLFLAGLMLYWGEGDSLMKNGFVRLTNTHPEMITIFTSFLIDVCDTPEEKIRVQMTLYPDLKEHACKDVWLRATRLRYNQFIKTQYIKGRHPTKRLSYGICCVYVTSRGLKEKIFTWLKLYKDELLCKNKLLKLRV
ncbi:MAG: hypothetical protein A3H64_01350 [Candidatus Ryanbacteria bacterium RIFCSPLOWO2_02_FULL_45_11c]|uniref:Uncharacterized protein n=1 Tax=Candidatus Ryanbacteria bacterium RIFCSPLOWO2_02_FULL_45_11c TaxID=1802128 RepID=A0A1G2GZB8_9BACT|nr:MAG: hypothetical protein A3H64_01350 [Candidatus Ryanbacteria bacterium RIFCSPLOWO2_02_FULL_45_11c]